MQTLEIPKSLAVGGKGCKLCKFWTKYEDREFKDSLGLIGNNWGRCTNSTNCILAKAELENKGTESIVKSKTAFNYLPSLLLTVVSTLSTFHCSSYRPN